MPADLSQLSGPIWIGGLAFGLAILLQLARLVRLGRSSGPTQTLRLDALWIAPAIYLALAALAIAAQPPHGEEWLWPAAGAALGGALGWWRGKTVEISLHPQTRALITRTSSTAMVFFIGLMALRFGLRYLLADQARTLHLTVTIITGAFLAFAVGLVVIQRLEMTLRAVRLLGAAPPAGARAPAQVILTPPVSVAATPPAGAAVARTGLPSAYLVMAAAAVFAAIVIVGLVMPH